MCVVRVYMGSDLQILLHPAVQTMHVSMRANSGFVSLRGRAKLSRNPGLVIAFFFDRELA